MCFIDLASPDTKYVGHAVSNPVQVENKPKVETLTQKPQPVEQPKQDIKPEIETTTKPEEIKETVEAPTQPVISQPKPSGNPWKDITSLIKSPPSKSFFETFAKPVELTDKKVVITFKDVAIQERAKENPKFDALKNACLSYFNVLSIEIEMKVGVAPNSIKTEPNIIEPKGAKPTIKQEQPQENQPIEDDIVDEISEDTEIIIEKPQEPLSDEAAMVVNLFGGKVIED